MPNGKRLKHYTLCNKVKLLRGGADYFTCIEQMADNATYSLHLQTYIYDGDETGTRIADALIRAAKRNVLVYMLVDGFASQHLSKAFINRLQAAGVYFAFFEPAFKSRTHYFGRRLHHKIVVADARTCLVAGVNISNRYNDINGVSAWLDWAIYAEGDVAKQLDSVCVKQWDRSVFRKNCIATNPPQFPPLLDTLPVRVRQNDWVFKKTQITATYRELFQTARSHVTLMSSYFLPPKKLLKKMAAASRSGVKIKLILTAAADVPLTKYAERYLYAFLFRNKIEVYEYQKNVLHGKIAVCDSEWLTTGSYNFNNLSAFASVELNLDIISNDLAAEVNDKFESIIKNDCIQITEADFTTNSSLLRLFFYYLSYRTVYLIFFLFTFYFTQKNEKPSHQ